ARPQARNAFARAGAEPRPPAEATLPGLAHAAVAPGTREARFAILVGRNVAGMGLGRHLMRRVARWARGKRLDAVHGDVLEDNGPLLDLARSMGFELVDGADPGFVRVRLPLAATTPVAGVDGAAG